jgi:Protein of unknown function (DUF3352)
MAAMRVWIGALLAGAALAVTGCGGGDNASATGGASAASLAPKSASAYASIATDLDSGQVEQLQELLAKFPDRQRLFDELERGLADEKLSWEQDVRPALGDVLDVVVVDLRRPATVALLKPADEAKLQALLQKRDPALVSRKVEGWTAVADDEAALDRFETARSDGSLADDAQFRDAMDGLPDEALAKLYVNGAALSAAAGRLGGTSTGANRLQAFAVALGAESDGLRLDGALHADLVDELSSAKPYEPTMLKEAPADSLAFLSGRGYGQVEKSLRDTPGALESLRKLLGLDAAGLTSLFEGEFALWVAPGLPIPEVTFLSEPEDRQRALGAIDGLARMLVKSGDAEQRTLEVDGVQARQVVTDGIPITWAAVDGRVIVTTRPGAIGDLRESGGHSLADAPAFEQAKEDAKLGDTTFGFLYLDVGKVVSLAEGLSALSGDGLPPELSRNLEPLGAFLLNASGEPEDLKLSAFLAIE